MQRPVLFTQKQAAAATAAQAGLMLLCAVVARVLWTWDAAVSILLIAGFVAYTLLIRIAAGRIHAAAADAPPAVRQKLAGAFDAAFAVMRLPFMSDAQLDDILGEDAWSQGFREEFAHLRKWARIWALPGEALIAYFFIRYVVQTYILK